MTDVMTNQPDVRSTSCFDDKETQTDRYLYISGFVRALELKLLDRARMNRLFEARQMEDIDRVLSESGYPPGDDPEERLYAEQVAILDWFNRQMPDPAFAETLIVFNDAHNLKLVLKKLLTIWIAGSQDDKTAKTPSADHEPDASLPDFMGIDGLPPIGSAVKQAMLPASMDPAILYRQIAQHQPEGVPVWLYRAAIEAVRRYLIRYELNEIDLYLDQVAWREAHERAQTTGNAFFCRFLQMKTDLINLDVLIRGRRLRMGLDLFKKAVLPGGSISGEKLVAVFDQDEESVLAVYRQTPYAELARLVRADTKQEDRERMGVLADNFLMEQLRTARLLTNGPEIPLAFVLARQLEIKNIRIVLTCLRNKLPSSRARELVRGSYLPWR